MSRRLYLALPLAAVIVLAGCRTTEQVVAPADPDAALQSELNAAYAEIERLREENATLRENLNLQRDTGERGQTVAILQSDILFESGSAELNPQGAARLREVADRLRMEFGGRTVRIEGYTDSQPIGPNLRTIYPSNWELSAARAGTVARYMQDVHNFDGRTMEVVGLGQFRPAATNETAEGRQQNRRVRIAVLVD